MSVAQINHATVGVACHAWNGDRTMCAVCPNSNEIHIYQTNGSEDFSTWTRAHTLTEHDLLVTAIDWSPVTNMIVSCSHDRNAFVWAYDEAQSSWSPSLVILRINRAALDVKWSPDGTKFAVASGAKVVPVCHYDEEGNWWVSKHIKKHKSTVTSVAWHPNSHIIATGCTDFKCRAFSAFVAEVDSGGEQDAGPYPEAKGFGECYAEYDGSRGWVHGCAWSPSGATLSYSGHDSTVSFVDMASQATQTLSLSQLPQTCLMFVSETACIAAGHEFNPMVFNRGPQGDWGFMQFIEEDAPAEENKAEEKAEMSQAAKARAMFGAMDKKGSGGGGGGGKRGKQECKVPTTLHRNAINCIQPKTTRDGGEVSCFTTSALDGKIVTWNFDSLNVDMASLGL